MTTTHRRVVLREELAKLTPAEREQLLRDLLPVHKPEPGIGDDVACSKCGAVALDTGLECAECGHDMWPELTGRKFDQNGADPT